MISSSVMSMTVLINLFIFQALYLLVPIGIPFFYTLIKSSKKLRMASIATVFALIISTFRPIPSRAKLINYPNPTLIDSLILKCFSFFNDSLKHYFSYRIIEDEALKKNKSYLIAAFPHGLQPFCFGCYMFDNMVKGEPVNVAGASVLFHLPIIRHLISFSGAVPATSRNLGVLLRRPYPYNKTVILPGGIAEMFLCRSDVEQIIIESRKGFIKVALKAGADIVPMYMFGNTQLYRVAGGKFGEFLQFLSRKLRMSIIGFHGRMGSLLPFPVPLTAVTGKPIVVPAPIPNPTEEQIEEYHQLFKIELRRIYDKYAPLLKDYAHKRLYFENETVPPPPPPAVAEFTRFPHKL
eukprot:c10915_g1_i1.p1 GENE.c10915_g1_i1~~c10915_g1_i1.p1  ORF type:complete len:351 (+),score=123.95 c10915_g1_i1:219-1271(+)